ncbi:MAG: diacylglycerol kinase family protein, partial [Mycobacteriales bacterium]
MDAVILAPGSHTRVPVLTCADALRGQSVIDGVDVLPADSDSDIDAALSRVQQNKSRLVVAGGDGVLRAVVRRMVRRAARRTTVTSGTVTSGTVTSQARADQSGHTAESKLSALPEHRTINDLAPLGLLPLDTQPQLPSLARSLELPSSPAEVAAAVGGGKTRRLDLFRSDHGGVTLHGILLGTTITDDASVDRLVAWQAHVEVDDTTLTSGDEPVLACAIANANGYAQLAGLPLLETTDPADGTVAIA